MNDRNELLDKLLSNDIMQVIQAIGTLIEHAKRSEDWAITTVESAIKSISEKENVEFFDINKGSKLDARSSIYTLGELIMHDQLLENIKYTQELISCSKDNSSEWESFINHSSDANRSRIILGILESHNRIQEELILNGGSQKGARKKENENSKSERLDAAVKKIAEETKKIKEKIAQEKNKKIFKWILKGVMVVGIIFASIVLITLIVAGVQAISRNIKANKLFKSVTEQEIWYEMNGYATVSFKDEKCTLTSNATGEKEVYACEYKANAKRGDIVFYKSDEPDKCGGLYPIYDKNTGELIQLYFYDNVYLTKDAVQARTFDETYEPYLEQAVEESENLFQEGTIKTPTQVMKRIAEDEEKKVNDVYNLISKFAYLTGENLPGYIEMPYPDHPENRLYLSKDKYSFVSLEYTPREFEMMSFDSYSDMEEHLMSTTWHAHGCYTNPNAKKFNDGYLDINFVRDALADVSISVSPNPNMTMSLAGLVSGEIMGSTEMRMDYLKKDESYIFLVKYGGDYVEYQESEYEIKVMFFVDKNGFLVQSAVLYDYKTDKIIPISNYTVYADGAHSIHREFVQKEFDSENAFYKALKANEWYLDDFAPTYIIDFYSPDIKKVTPEDTIKIDEQVISGSVLRDDGSLFSSRGEISIYGQNYVIGYVISIDAEDKLSLRLALHDEQNDEYKFTAQSWLYNKEKPEESE